MYARIVKMLLEAFPQTYSEKLGFSLESGLSGEVFKWFLTSLFFGKPTGEAQAMNTYRYFVKHGLTTPEGILDAGWERLVHVLDEKAMRYDFSTADKLLEVAENIQKWYGEDLNILRRKSSCEEDLVKRLKSLGKGIGDGDSLRLGRGYTR